MIRIAVIKNGGATLTEKAGLTGLLVDSSDAVAREGQVVASFPQVFEAMRFKTHRSVSLLMIAVSPTRGRSPLLAR